MSEPTSHSVTNWVRQLASSDRAAQDDAASRLWARYQDKLINLARERLSQRVRQREDEHDVAADVYQSFCQRCRLGEVAVESRDELIAFLITCTRRRAAKVARKHTRQKRDVRREAGAGGGEDDLPMAATLPDGGPSPEEAMLFAEECERRLKVLDDTCRRIALLKLAGLTDAQIAAPDQLNVSTRTIERKTRLIQDRWQEMDAADPP